MKAQDHIGLISWSLLDKGLFLLYGFVMIIVMNYTAPKEFGLFSLLIALHTWIFTVSDSFALQSLIQFGMNKETRYKVNLISLIIHVSLTMTVSLLIYIFRDGLASLFQEERIKEIGAFLPLLSLAFIPRSYCQKIIYRIQNMKFLFFVNLIFFGSITALIFNRISQVHVLQFSDLSIFYLVGSGLSSLIAVILIRKELKFEKNASFKLSKFFQFGWQMTTTSLLFTLPRQLDVLFLKLFFSLETVGLYSAAKNIFRVFDEAMSAISGLIYPSAVRQINNQNRNALVDLLSKSSSFMFFAFGLLIVLLTCGLSNVMFTYLLPQRYLMSQNYFNILLIGALFLPFTFIYSVMVALDKLKKIILVSFIGNIIFFFSIYIIGSTNNINWTPIPLIIYYAYLGFTGALLSYKLLNITPKMMFRAYFDIKNYLQSSLKK